MKYAGFFRRVFSLVYDSFLVLGIILVFTFGLVFLHGGYEKMGIVGQILQLFIILLSGPCYYIYFWLKNKGQTTGMQAWKIQLVSHDDKPIKIKQAFIRCISSIFTGLLFGLGYFSIFRSKDKISWSDRISNTRIVNKKLT